jgi:hypothetical protein
MFPNIIFVITILFLNFKNHFLHILSLNVDINEEDDGEGLYVTMNKCSHFIFNKSKPFV